MTVRFGYLAGPIRSQSDSGQTWRKEVAAQLSSLGVVFFDPSTAFHRAPALSVRQAASMETLNRVAIDHADFVVAYLPDGALALGTIREIEYARSKDKPVYVMSDQDIKQKVSAHDLVLFRQWEALVMALFQFVGRRPGDYADAGPIVDGEGSDL